MSMGAIGMALVCIVWLLPVVLILISNKTSGAEKLVWICLLFLFSWFIWILYALLAPISKK